MLPTWLLCYQAGAFDIVEKYKEDHEHEPASRRRPPALAPKMVRYHWSVILGA
jgi:hypothetical protein